MNRLLRPRIRGIGVLAGKLPALANRDDRAEVASEHGCRLCAAIDQVVQETLMRHDVLVIEVVVTRDCLLLEDVGRGPRLARSCADAPGSSNCYLDSA